MSAAGKGIERRALEQFEKELLGSLPESQEDDSGHVLLTREVV